MNKQIQQLIKIALVLLIVFLLYQLSFLFTPLLIALNFLFVPMVFSLLIYYLLKHLLKIFEKKYSHKLSAVFTFLIFILALIMLIGTFGFFFVNQFDELGEVASEQYEQYQEDPGKLVPEFLEGYINVAEIESSFTARLNDLTSWLQENFSEVFSTVTEIPTQMVLVLFLIFYLLMDGHNFYEKFREFIPYSQRARFVESVEKVDSVLSVYVKGQIIVAFFTGLGMLIVYLIVGIPLAPVLGIFAMITSLVPFIGPIIGVIPAIIIGLGEGGWTVLQIIIGTLIVQQLEGDLISPKVLGGKLKIHPLTIIVLIMLAVTIYGIIGAFVAVPAYAAFREIATIIYRDYKAKKNQDYR